MRGASAGDGVDTLLRRPVGVWPRLDKSERRESTHVHLHESGLPIRRSGNGVHESHSRTSRGSRAHRGPLEDTDGRQKARGAGLSQSGRHPGGARQVVRTEWSCSISPTAISWRAGVFDSCSHRTARPSRATIRTPGRPAFGTRRWRSTMRSLTSSRSADPTSASWPGCPSPIAPASACTRNAARKAWRTSCASRQVTTCSTSARSKESWLPSRTAHSSPEDQAIWTGLEDPRRGPLRDRSGAPAPGGGSRGCLRRLHTLRATRTA